MFHHQRSRPTAAETGDAIQRFLESEALDTRLSALEVIIRFAHGLDKESVIKSPHPLKSRRQAGESEPFIGTKKAVVGAFRVTKMNDDCLEFHRGETWDDRGTAPPRGQPHTLKDWFRVGYHPTLLLPTAFGSVKAVQRYKWLRFLRIYIFTAQMTLVWRATTTTQLLRRLS